MINITINSFNTDLSKDDRYKLYPKVGILFPDATQKLSRVDDYDQVKVIIDQYPLYKSFFDLSESDGQSLEDKFFEREAALNKGNLVVILL